jgi:RND family efflux transporter MFP subunit
VAGASLAEARAQLAQAQLDLERTVVAAPFDGRVRERIADVGQFVNPGTRLARIYAVDYAEVRLPVATPDLEHIDVPFVSFDDAVAPAAPGDESPPGVPVMLRGHLAGRDVEWPARLVRAEGEIDARTRTLHVVARVDDPYGRRTPVVEGSAGPPLPAGLFVEAQIEGRERAGVFALPAMAVRDGDQVYVVAHEDGDERLRVRRVEVVRRSRDEVIVGDGLEPGDRVIVSPLRAVSDGMRLRLAGASAANAPEVDASPVEATEAASGDAS